MRRSLIVALGLVVGMAASASLLAAPFDGQADYATGAHGYYYAITGGKFPTGNIPNGKNSSGGTFRFILDAPEWGYAIQQWNKDSWFEANASLALTLKNGSAIVYDNNGIEDGTHGDFYDATGLASSNSKPGLFRGYSMSNNWDWIYAGYFLLEEETTITQIIGYYDENAGFDSDSPHIQFDMNIWSAFQDIPDTNPNSWMPAVASFTGDVFSAKSTAGTFTWEYTGVDRVFGDDFGNMTDEIWRLVYTLDQPMVLPAGVYFFSHDAEIHPVPEPLTIGLGAIALVGVGLAATRRRRMA